MDGAVDQRSGVYWGMKEIIDQRSEVLWEMEGGIDQRSGVLLCFANYKRHLANATVPLARDSLLRL